MATRLPLFSRRQLTAIILITATIIALLSIPSSPWPEIQRTSLAGHSLIYQVNADQPIQLRLSFALTDVALLPSDTALLLWQLLEQRTEEQKMDINIMLHPDRLTVKVTATSVETLTQLIQQIPSLLLRPFTAPPITEKIQRLYAQRHLQKEQPQPLRKADTWLRQQLNNSRVLDHEHIALLQQQTFAPARLSLSLSGAEPQSLLGPLTSLLEQLPASKEPLPTIAPTSAATTPIEMDPGAVIAIQPLTGRQDANYPRALLLSHLLEKLTPDINLKLIPGAQTSWLLWIAPAVEKHSEVLRKQTELIKQQLMTMPDWELETAAKELLQQLKEHLREPETADGHLENVAFYQLPLDYLPRFEATISTYTGAQIRQQLLEMIGPAGYSYPPASLAIQSKQ